MTSASACFLSLNPFIIFCPDYKLYVRSYTGLEQQLTEERAKKKHKSSSDSLDTTTGSTPSQSPRSHKSSRATPAGAAAVVAPTPTAPPSQPHPQAPLGRQVENALGNQESAASLRRDLATSACIVTRGDWTIFGAPLYDFFLNIFLFILFDFCMPTGTVCAFKSSNITMIDLHVVYTLVLFIIMSQTIMRPAGECANEVE